MMDVASTTHANRRLALALVMILSLLYAIAIVGILVLN